MILLEIIYIKRRKMLFTFKGRSSVRVVFWKMRLTFKLSGLGVVEFECIYKWWN